MRIFAPDRIAACRIGLFWFIAKDRNPARFAGVSRPWSSVPTVADDLKKCEFPGKDEIGICGNQDEVAITVTPKGLDGNMQTNAAAFEAWALVLLFHCQVKRIKIGLAPGAEELAGGHVERFLYRLHRFGELFPDRIEPDATLRGSARALNGTIKRVLNQPLTDRESIGEKRDELLFYASVMRDAIRGEFQFEQQPLPKNCVVTRDDILGCSNIRAVLIAQRMHPLIQSPVIFQTLNAALAQHWRDKTVTFETAQIKNIPSDPDGDFSF